MHSLRYEAHRKFGEHERCVTSQVLHILMNAQLTYEPIVLSHFQPKGKFFLGDSFADVMSMHNRNMKHARTIEFD